MVGDETVFHVAAGRVIEMPAITLKEGGFKERTDLKRSSEAGESGGGIRRRLLWLQRPFNGFEGPEQHRLL